MVILERRSYFVPSTSFQSTKPSSSFSQSRKSRKLDFESMIYLLDLEPEDSGYKLLSALTNNGKMSIAPIISLSRSELKEIRVAGANQTTLAFDDWEVAEILNIHSYFMHKKSEANEHYQLKDVDASAFEDFKWSTAYSKMTSTREDTPSSSSTRGQPNSSGPSISPTHVALHSSLSTANGEPSLQDEEDRDIPSDEVDVDRSFKRSIVSSDDVGRSFAVEPNSNRHHHQAYDHSSNLLTSNDKIHTYSPESEVPSSSARIREAQLQDLQDLNQSHFESHSSTFECEELPNFKLDLESFENYLLNETSDLRDDFSCSSYSSSASSASHASNST